MNFVNDILDNQRQHCIKIIIYSYVKLNAYSVPKFLEADGRDIIGL